MTSNQGSKHELVTLDVGDGAAEGAGPVDEAVGAVDGAVVVHADEGLGDGAAHLGVHGEDGALPVDGAAEAAHLVVDGGAVLLLPLPDLLHELLAAVVVAGLLLSPATEKTIEGCQY